MPSPLHIIAVLIGFYVAWKLYIFGIILLTKILEYSPRKKKKKV